MMRNRLPVLFIIFALLALNTLPLLGQDQPQPGDAVIFTAESAPVYAQPDADSTQIAVFYQGYVDRMGPLVADGWAYLSDLDMYVRLDESGLAIRTDDLQQQLLDAVTAEIEQDPQAVDAFIRRGTIYMFMQHNYEAAVEDCTRAIELAPDDGRAYALRGWVLGKMHHLTRAIADYEQAIALGEISPWTMNALGFLNDDLESYEEAERWYQQVADQYPDFSWSFNSLGNMRYNERDYAAAFDHYDQATVLDPYNNAPYFNRALIYRKQDDYAPALAELNRAVQQNPYNPEVYVRLADVYAFYLDDAQSGLDNVEKALAIEPDYSEAYEVRAMIYAYEIYDSTKATSDLKTALRLDPYNITAIDRAAFFFARIGDFDRALEYFDKELDFEPLVNDLYLYRAQVHFCLGNYERARQDAQLYIDTGQFEYISDLAWAYLELAMIALQEGDYEEAYRDYSFAFSLDTKWTLNWQEKKGRRVIDSRAVLAQTYAQNIQDNPTEPKNYLQLGHILMEFGAWEEAIDYYRQYLTMVDDPDLETLVGYIASKLDAD